MAAIQFPPLSMAREDGLLAVGGNLKVPTLLNAYGSGIFPWPLGDDAPFLNEYAWYLATHDVQLERAEELARRAISLSPESGSQTIFPEHSARWPDHS